MKSNPPIFGKKAIAFRKNRIKNLLSIVKGKRWKYAFFEKYSHLNNSEGVNMIINGQSNNCDDPELLRCLEEFIDHVLETLPEWFTKKSKTNDTTTPNQVPAS